MDMKLSARKLDKMIEEATVELQRCAGTQFDPRVVDALVAVRGL